MPQAGTIDQDRELIDTAVESGLIERRGAWFNFEDKKWNGLGAIDLSAEDQIKLKGLINA